MNLETKATIAVAAIWILAFAFLFNFLNEMVAAEWEYATTRQQCLEIFFGDNSSSGYNNTAAACLKLLK